MTAVRIVLALFAATLLAAQSDPWKSLAFLEGTWDARTQGGKPGVASSGTYTFRKELGGHVLARHSSSSGCKGPTDFDCEHGDLLYIFQDAAGQPLKAIYFDNEGHVIHYNVSAPDTASAVFVSDPASPGPQFRLIYSRHGSSMSGKFQMRIPPKTEWTSYLEWSGAKK